MEGVRGTCRPPAIDIKNLNKKCLYMPPKNNKEKQVEVNLQKFDMESIGVGKKLLFIGIF